MIFFRVRGQSISLVQGGSSGERRGQSVLHTFPNRAELQRTLGTENWERFCFQIEQHFPQLAPDWGTIRAQGLALCGEPSAVPTRSERREKVRRALKFLAKEIKNFRADRVEQREDLLALGEQLIDTLHAGLAAIYELQGHSPVEAWEQAGCFLPNPEHADALVEHAREAAARRNYKRAGTLFEQARNHNPFDPDVINSEGVVALERKRYAEARTLFQDARRLADLQLGATRRKVYSWSDHRVRPYLRATANLALTAEAEGSLEEALALHHECLAVCPDDGLGSRFCVPVLLHKMGRFEEAIGAYRECMGTNLVEVPDPYFNAAAAAIQLDKTLLAAELLLQGASLNPFLLDALQRKSRALAGAYAANSPEYALEYFRQYGQLWNAKAKRLLTRLLSASALRSALDMAQQAQLELHDERGTRRGELLRQLQSASQRLRSKELLELVVSQTEP